MLTVSRDNGSAPTKPASNHSWRIWWSFRSRNGRIQRFIYLVMFLPRAWLAYLLVLINHTGMQVSNGSCSFLTRTFPQYCILGATPFDRLQEKKDHCVASSLSVSEPSVIHAPQAVTRDMIRSTMSVRYNHRTAVELGQPIVELWRTGVVIELLRGGCNNR